MLDTADCAINALTNALRVLFADGSPAPPIAGGTGDIRFFAGDAPPFAAWNLHSNQTDCHGPFVWVRVVNRFRSTATTFPAPYGGDNPCGSSRTITLEVGVARCAVVDADPSWEEYENEAEVSLDDSWRIEQALCVAAGEITRSQCGNRVGVGVISPYGPEGGLIAWTGTLTVQLA